MTTVTVTEDVSIVNVTGNDTVVTISTEGTVGRGVPAEGLTGQLLAKASDSDYDTEWIDPALPSTTSPSNPSGVPASFPRFHLNTSTGQLWFAVGDATQGDWHEVFLGGSP